MKKFLCLLIGALSLCFVEAQGMGVVYRNEVLQFKGDVCKLTVKINYWDRETWTYWYDSNGRVVRYHAQKFRGKDTPVRFERVTLTPEGKLLNSVVETYENGVQAGVQRNECSEYNGGDVVEIPSPKFEYAYYKVPGKVDSAGNWLQISRSYGNYSEIISREIEYRSSMTAETKAEFDEITKSNDSTKAHFEHLAQVAAQEKEKEERGEAYVALIAGIVGLMIFLLLCNNIRNVMLYKNSQEVLRTSLNDYNRHPKSLYLKVLLAILLWPMTLIGAFAVTSEHLPLIFKILAGITVAFGILVAIWWIVKGMRTISKNMVLNRTLKNGQITKYMLAMVIGTGFFCVYPMLSSYMPDFIAAFLTFVALCLYYAIFLGGMLTGRCPRCNAYYETESLGQESRGLVKERSRETSTSTKGDHTLRKTHLREKTYEKYVTLWRCNECGYEWEVKNRRLISDKKTLVDVDWD